MALYFAVFFPAGTNFCRLRSIRKICKKLEPAKIFTLHGFELLIEKPRPGDEVVSFLVSKKTKSSFSPLIFWINNKANLALVRYEEFRRPQRVSSTSAFGFGSWQPLWSAEFFISYSTVFNNWKKTSGTRVTPRATISTIFVCKHENPTTYCWSVETNQVPGTPAKSLDDSHLYQKVQDLLQHHG